MTAPPESPPRDAPPRRGGLLRGLAATTLVALLVGAALVGGAITSAGIALWRAAESETALRRGPSVLSAVRDLARLETVSYHVERVIDLEEEQRRFFGLVPASDAILLVAAGDVSAGVDLSELRAGDVDADADTGRVTLTLPAPRVFATHLDDERTYVHARTTDVLARRRENLEQRARKEASRTLEEAALEAGILERARENAERTITSLLRSLGHRDVAIRWR